MIPGKMVKGMGGAMDLVHGARESSSMMEHVDQGRAPQDRRDLHAPAHRPRRASHRIVTDLGVIDVTADGGLLLREVAPGITLDTVVAATGAELTVDPA